MHQVVLLGIAPKVDSFYSIELELGDEQITDIQTLINNFEKCEKLETKRFCSNCSIIRTFEKSFRIRTIPSWLVVLFKRFTIKDGRSEKLNNDVAFVCEDFSLEGKTFDLYGAICHSGSKESGHYYSFVLFRGQWFLCNDDKISSVSKDSLSKCQKEAYMLFYKLRS